jgi:xylulokinase
MSLYIGLDLGTQGAKAVVYDARNKRIVSRGAQAYGFLETNVPGRAEQDPEVWLQV